MDSTTFAGGAGAAEISSFASPLEQVFRNVTKAHEKPLRRAVYNVLAILVLGLISYGSYYVVFVLLWPFFSPIMWALMTGLVIHPHKTYLAAAMRQTLADMAASEKTTIVAVLYGCVGLVDGACEAIGGYVVAKWKMVSAIAVVFGVVQATMTLDPSVLPVLFSGAFSAFNSLSSLTSCFQSSRNLLIGSIFTYLVSVIILWTPDRSLVFKSISYILWLWLFVYFLNYVSFLYCLGTFFILKIFFRATTTEEEEDRVDAGDFKGSPSDGKRTRFRETVFAVLKRLQGAPNDERPSKKMTSTKDSVDSNDDVIDEPTVVTEKSVKNVDEKEHESEVPVTPIVARPVDAMSTPNLVRPMTSDIPLQLSAAKIEHPGVSAIRRFHMSRLVSGSTGNINNMTTGSEMFSSPKNKTMYNSTPSSSRPFRKHYRTVLSRGSAGSCSEGSDGQLTFVKESDVYINLVTGCFVVLQLWIHPILLHLLPVPIAYSLIKRGIFNLGSSDQFSSIASQVRGSISKWIEIRSDVIVPRPATFIWKEMGRLKRALLQVLPKYSDTIVTAVLIMACIVSSVFLVIFVSLQIYAESLYLVQMGGRVFATVANSSLYQQFNATDFDSSGNNTYAKGLEEAIDSAYIYGRDYISSTVVSILGETRDRAAVHEFETKLLELWDRIYQYWLSSRTGPSTSPLEPTFGPQVSQEAIATSAEEVLHRLINMNDFNLSSVSQFAVNNMGTLTSVLEQGWILLMSNASFALGVATEIIRILFLSGYGMVNFVFGMAVYFSALFYLLKIEGPVYKPVEVISSYGHLVGDGFASALNKAVNSVFTLTAKMAYFYGAWTYVTHTVFHASIVTVPVLAAAFLAAVPIAGQFLVALPAAMELWLAEDRWGSAVALIACHLVPPYVVDAAIYSEVRHGIHPWITGLSIVGGVYCFGIPGGAIYGPVILCIVYVVWTMTMYTGFLHPFGFEMPLNEHNLGKSKLILNTPLLKRSESIF